MKHNKELIILLVVSAFALYINVGVYGVVESSDARYAEIAREMYVSGDYLHPNLLGVHHYHKPPFTYQITALGYSIFGINPFGARFFLQMAILFQIVLVYFLSLNLFDNRKTALLAAIIYFSFPIVLMSSRNLTTDAFLATFTLLSMYSWVKYRKTGLWRYLYLFTFSLALGFLTKGPLVFIVPVLFIIPYNRTEKPKNKLGLHHVLAWLLFVAVGFSWYLILVNENPEFLSYFLGHQTADRFARNAFDRTEPFWYFIVLAPLVGIPWLLLLPFLIRKNIKLFKRDSVYVALLIGIFVPLLFFSVSSSKRILYILPFYSLLAVLISRLVTELTARASKTVGRVIYFYAIVVFSAFAASQFLDSDFVIPSLAVVTGVFMIIIVSLIYFNKNADVKVNYVLISFVVSAFLLIASSHVMIKNELKVNITEPVTAFIVKQGLDNREIIVYNTRKPSIAFGLDKPVISLYDGSKDLARETQFETDTLWKQYLIDMSKEDEVARLKNILARPSVLLVYKNPLPENREWLKSGFGNVEVMDKWYIYY